MPHSLRAKLNGLAYKKIITEKELHRLKDALDFKDAFEKINSVENVEEDCKSRPCAIRRYGPIFKDLPQKCIDCLNTEDGDPE